MTPTIALIAVSLIAAGLCVAVGIMQWRITALKADATYARFKAEKQTEHYEELLTEARNEAKTEYDLRRQAEKNLAKANKEAQKWEIESNGLHNTCDDLFDVLVEAVEKMPVPFHLRKRDESGRFVKASAYDIATNMLINKQIKMDRFGWGVPKPSTLIETDGLTARVVAKPHTLRHGMTVKDPTPEQAKEIFDEANRLGIKTTKDTYGQSCPHIWFYDFNEDSIYGADSGVGVSVEPVGGFLFLVTASQFLAHMRGEDPAQAEPISPVDGLTVRKLCDEVKENANAGI